MLNRFFPRSIDNTYSGQRLALWIFALVVIVKTVQSVLAIFNGPFVLVSADGIPLDTFTRDGAQTVVAVWALSGLYRLIIYALCLLVLVRYRSAIPFMFALLVLLFLGAELILIFIPLVRTGTPAGPFVNRILFGLVIVGLPLSLWNHSVRGNTSEP